MSFPKDAELRIALLREIKSSEGALRWGPYIYDTLASCFPQLTSEERQTRNESGNKWQGAVRRVRDRANHKGLIKQAGKNTWSITSAGETVLHEFDVEMPGLSVKHPVESQWDHDEMGEALKEIGQFMGRYAEVRYDIGGCELDVVWKRKKTDYFVTHAFEVHRSGQLKNALHNLRRAKEKFFATRLFLVCDQKDWERVQRVDPAFVDLLLLLTPARVLALIKGLRDLDGQLGNLLASLILEPSASLP